MIRALAVVLALAVASPASAQSYIAASFGTNVTLANRIDTSQPDLDLNTAFAVGGRAGISLGPQWGAELEVSRALEVSASQSLTQRIFNAGPTALVGVPGLSLPPAVIPQFEINATARRHGTSVSPTLWYSHSLAGAFDLVLLGGASFDRVVTDSQFDVRAPNPILALITVPAATRAIQHHVGVLAGMETRIALGTHLRVIPGIRLQGVSNGWAVRPAVAIGWAF